MEGQFEPWEGLTDLGVLRCLKLNWMHSVSLLETLASMARSGKLRSLRELQLGANEYQQPTDHPNVDRPTSLLLIAAPPLEVLKLYHCFGEHIFEAALNCHSQTLRELEMHPTGEDPFILSHSRVREIQQRCPNLQKLDLTIHRHQGGPEEVAIYWALGQLARLRRVTLILVCGSILTGSYGRESLEKILINATESLARAIFQEMSARSNAPLQRLRLEMDDLSWGSTADWVGIDRLVHWVGRS